MGSIIKPAVVRRSSHSSRSFLIHGKRSMALNDVGLLVLSHPKHGVSFFSQSMPLTIYTGGAKGVDTHVERLCQTYGHACVVLIPPSSQVSRALDAIGVGRCHPHRDPGRVSIGSTSASSHQSPVYPAECSRDPAGVFSLGRGLF